MLYVLLIAIPVTAGLLSLLVTSDARRPWLLPVGCGLHAALVLRCWIRRPEPALSGRLALDDLGLLVITLASVMLLVCSVYCLEYLRLRRDRNNRLFTACLAFILGAVSLVAMSRHLGLLWVGMELATLAGAPLIHFNQNERSLEAAWKYLMMGSLGIGLALLGTFFLALAGTGQHFDPLVIDAMVANAGSLSQPWLKGAFVFILVGYGTKMGLAPMHSWKPDAYGETPGVAGAVLAGVVTSCAFLGILRVFQICAAAGLADFARGLLVLMGLLSMGTAAVFVLGQRDFKRMLAYSSVEHMGILALGVGLGPAGTFAALLHMINNALVKGVMFLTAGNIHRAFGNKTLDRVQGALRLLPISAALFLVGFIAVTGSPPFGPFISEFAVLRATIDGDRLPVAVGFVTLLSIIFIGMAQTTLTVVFGDPVDVPPGAVQGDSAVLVAAPAILMVAVLALGLYLPEWLTAVLASAARLVNTGSA